MCLNNKIKYLTTVIGIRCKDGVVIACDSQGSYVKGLEMKRLDVNKIFPIMKKNQPTVSLALAGSGDTDHIKILVEELNQALGDREFNDRDLRENIEEILLRLHKKYNLERSRFLGLSEENMFFAPYSILGARLKGDNSFGLYLLRPDGWVNPIDEYETIGSGAPFADLMLKQINRSLTVANMTLSSLNVRDAIMFSSYIINEVKTSDRYSGGLTRIGVVDINGFRQLPESEVISNYNEFLDIITKGLGASLVGSVGGGDKLKRMFPSP